MTRTRAWNSCWRFWRAGNPPHWQPLLGCQVCHGLSRVKLVLCLNVPIGEHAHAVDAGLHWWNLQVALLGWVIGWLASGERPDCGLPNLLLAHRAVLVELGKLLLGRGDDCTGFLWISLPERDGLIGVLLYGIALA
jgi:hypothetical protein